VPHGVLTSIERVLDGPFVCFTVRSTCCTLVTDGQFCPGGVETLLKLKPVADMVGGV
jgi:hypothetical protein